jgi:hypothetical protein
MQRLTTLLLFTVFLTNSGIGQDDIYSWDFYHYLKSERLYRESITWLDNYSLRNDSAAFEIFPEKARIYLMQTNYDSSHYYYCRCDLGNDTSEIYTALCISLVVKDTAAFSRYLIKYPFLLEEKDVCVVQSVFRNNTDMCEILSERPDIFSSFVINLCKYDSKSPLISGMLSALIPGLGKWYAGNWHQAKSTFITNVILGAVLAEALIVPAAAVYIAYCLAVSAVFYAGNIWGSSALVLKNRRDFYQQIHEDISDYYTIKLQH